jgi:uncharacterized protein (TIGR03000 family)
MQLWKSVHGVPLIHRVAIAASLLIAVALPALFAQQPPPVRNDRSRPALQSNAYALPAFLYSPNDAATLAAADIEAIFRARAAVYGEQRALSECSYVRYVTAYNTPASLRSGTWQQVSFLLNSLSRLDEIIRPALPSLPDNILLRLDLRDYDLLPEDWDRFGITEPYFHQDVAESRVLSVQTGTVLLPSPATIILHCPPNAAVTIDGNATAQTGPQRTYHTPALDSGKEFTYRVQASWEGKTATVIASVRGGSPTTIRFTAAGDLGRVPPDVPFTVNASLRTEATGKKVRALAGWIDPAVNSKLAYYTQSRAPIIRADWFIANASQPPAYYDLLRLKTLKDYLDLAGFDERAQDRKEVRATVVKSGSHGLTTPVARHNRILARQPTFQGAIWQTFDFETSIGAANVIANFLNIRQGSDGTFEVGGLSGLDPQSWLREIRKRKLGFRDAAEYIANLPNGLQFYFLTDGADKRLNEGAIAVVTDSTSLDFRVINGRSCIWCHQKGIQPFESQFQRQIGAAQFTDLGIGISDENKAAELSRFIRRVYGTPQFGDYVQTDQQFYARAVASANGLAVVDNAQTFRARWNEYAEVDLDMNRICFELGLQPRQVEALIALRLNGVNNGVLLQQLLKPPISVRRDHFEEAFPDIASLSGYAPKGK